MFHRLVLLILVIALSTFLSIAQGANDEQCSMLVEEALALVDNACSGLGRNQACYGHNLVTATGIDDSELDEFVNVGDVVGLEHILSLATAPMQLADDVWGIAILGVQANLPGALPGQNVTFVVFGDVELVNEVDSTIVLNGQSLSNANLRSGPGTNYNVVGALSLGDEITLKGRNENGDWGQIIVNGAAAWIHLSLVDVDGDVTTLPVANPDDIYTAPMQAFQFRSGIGKPACEEAPPNGLLIQAPTDTIVKFLVNGIEMEVGSTALLIVDDEQTDVNTFDGTVTVTSSGDTQQVLPGYRTTVTANTAPIEPEVYVYEDVQAVPISLLPETITIPITVHANAIGEESGWVYSGIMLESGESFSIKATGEVNMWVPCEEELPPEQHQLYCPININGPAGTQETVRELYDPTWDFSLESYPMPDESTGGLIARIGDGEMFFVGDGGTFIANNDGELQFLINDTDYFYDNAGGFVVEITVDN